MSHAPFTIHQALFEEAKRHFPGGVNAPRRAVHPAGAPPIFIESAKGAYLFDVEGKHYIDFVCNWGANLLGHAHPSIVKAVQGAADRGLGFGVLSPYEAKFAALLKRKIPYLSKIRLVGSGAEACASAVRVARGFTGRDLIVKFEGCDHGHPDSPHVKSGANGGMQSVPDSAGVSEGPTQKTILLPYNDKEALTRFFEEFGFRTAGALIEPIAVNMGFVPSDPSFLSLLRNYTKECDALLIFDEVMSGFRVAEGGASALYGIRPDLVCLGQVLGGGLPLAAFGGEEEVMNVLSPLGPVYQSDPLSGNPLALCAGIAVLENLDPWVYAQLSELSAYWVEGLSQLAKKYGIPILTYAQGGLWGLFFTQSASVRTFEEVAATHHARRHRFFLEMLSRGVYLTPSTFDAGFISLAHTQAILDLALSAADPSFAILAREAH